MVMLGSRWEKFKAGCQISSPLEFKEQPHPRVLQSTLLLVGCCSALVPRALGKLRRTRTLLTWTAKEAVCSLLTVTEASAASTDCFVASPFSAPSLGRCPLPIQVPQGKPLTSLPSLPGCHDPAPTSLPLMPHFQGQADAAVES